VGLYILYGIISGIVVAWLLNAFIADKIKYKIARFIVKAVAFIVLVVFGLLLGFVCSIKPTLNNFLVARIDALEITLNKHFPDKNLMEYSINTIEFSTNIDIFRQSIGDINIGTDGIFKRIVFSAFLERVNIFVDDVHRGINTTSITIGNNQGDVSLKSILYYLKGVALRKVTPYIVLLILLITTGVVIFLAIYLGICKLLIKKTS